MQGTNVSKYGLGVGLVLLLFITSSFTGNGVVLASGSSDSSQLSSGQFAYYTESTVYVGHLAGYPSVISAGSARTAYFLNQSSNLPYSSYTSARNDPSFSSLTVGWEIESVRADSYLVNYTVFLAGLDRASGHKDRLSESVIVSRTNNTAYWLNGTAFGTWPYWLDYNYRVPGASITLIHRFPIFGSSLNETGSLVFLTDEAFTSLPQGGSAPNQTSTTDFLRSSLNLGSQGVFLSDRLLVTYPYFRILPSPIPNTTTTTSNPFWVGIYDRLSGILLAQDHSFYFFDDVLLHSGLGVWQIGFPSPSLTLNSTNLDLSPDTLAKPNLIVPALLIFGLIGTFIVASAFVVHRRSKHGAK